MLFSFLNDGYQEDDNDENDDGVNKENGIERSRFQRGSPIGALSGHVMGSVSMIVYPFTWSVIIMIIVCFSLLFWMKFFNSVVCAFISTWLSFIVYCNYLDLAIIYCLLHISKQTHRIHKIKFVISFFFSLSPGWTSVQKF